MSVTLKTPSNCQGQPGQVSILGNLSSRVSEGVSTFNIRARGHSTAIVTYFITTDLDLFQGKLEQIKMPWRLPNGVTGKGQYR